MIKNAIIESTMLGREEHGIMTFMLFISFDDITFCGVGGYALDERGKTSSKRVFQAKSMEAISKVLEVVGVTKWEDLPGKYIRFEDNEGNSPITKIGNILSGKWFDLKEFFGGQ